MRSLGPLRLAAKQQQLRIPGSIRVLPAFPSQRLLPSRLARLRDLDGRSAVRVRGAGTEFDSLREYDMALYRQISEVRRESDGEYTFLTADGGVPVMAGLPADIPSRLRKLDLFLTTVLAARGTDQASSVDLRWKGQVVVRWRGATASAGA